MRQRVSLQSYKGCIVIGSIIAFNAFAVATQERFEVASIKPNAQGFIDLGGGARLLSGATRCRASDSPVIPGDPLAPAALGRCSVRNSTLKEMINAAYSLRLGAPRSVLNQFVIGGPEWTNTQTFDIDAKVEDSTDKSFQQLLTLFQNLISERFRLRFHRENRDVSGFALVVSRSGSKLIEAQPGDPQSFTAAPTVRGQKMPVSSLANLISQRTGRVVLDKTGLAGQYNFTLTWTPDETEFGVNGLPAVRAADQTGPSLVTALQDQLGLRLESQKVPMEVFVIDSVEMPTAN